MDQAHRYSDIFHDLQNQDYYEIPKERLSHVHYSKLAKPAQQNIYITKDFADPRMAAAFDKTLSENQRTYRENGYLILRGLIPEDLIDAYVELRERLKLGQDQFPDATPFIEHPEILDIACHKPMIDVIRELHAAEMGLIFTLTGFKSTERGWHQDAYLDRDSAVPRLATWIACGTVDADCGPFEYVPGSHKWMALSNERINEFLKPDFRWPEGHRARSAGVPGWGRIAEGFVDPSVYAKIDRDGAEIKHFTAEKGDVLFWYGRLMHRGSPPRRNGATRPGLIAHYAPIFERERGFFDRTASGSHYIVPPSKIGMLAA